MINKILKPSAKPIMDPKLLFFGNALKQFDNLPKKTSGTSVSPLSQNFGALVHSLVVQISDLSALFWTKLTFSQKSKLAGVGLAPEPYHPAFLYLHITQHFSFMMQF